MPKKSKTSRKNREQVQGCHGEESFKTTRPSTANHLHFAILLQTDPCQNFHISYISAAIPE